MSQKENLEEIMSLDFLQSDLFQSDLFQLNFSLLDLSQFHFIRAELLWLIIPCLLSLFAIRSITKNKSSWEKVVSPHLLKFLIVSQKKQTKVHSFWLSLIICCLIIFAISGPSFRQQAIPIIQTESARVIVLDLSLSMDATDIKPSRLDRARFKIMDILNKNTEGTIGIVVYAGDAFVISPLTSDAKTIASFVPTLSTGVMPVLGSRPDLAIQQAINLLKNAKQPTGQIIWLTDGVNQRYTNIINNQLNQQNYLLSILAIGTPQGAPIKLPRDKGFLKDKQGNIVLPKLDSQQLKKIAQHNNGQYVELSSNDDDVNFIMSLLEENNDQTFESDEKISQWLDDGYWLSWIILVLIFIRLFKQTSPIKTNPNQTNQQMGKPS